MKVLITDSIPNVCNDILIKAGLEVDKKVGLNTDKLKKIIANYHGLIVRSSTRVTHELLEKAFNLKVIVRAGTGVDNIDIKAAKDRGVFVMNTPGVNSNAVAELTIGLMIAISRHIPYGTNSIKMCRWEKATLIGHELKGKTLCIIGIGKIGSIVARIAKGLNMKIIGHSRSLKKTKAQKLGIKLGNLDEVLSKADYVSIHLPKTEMTTNLINTKRFARMKKGAYLICTARGGIVDENALFQALRSGRLAGAALDVFEKEPPDVSPLIDCPNFIGTPHLGASTYEAQKNIALAAGKHMRDFLLNGIICDSLN